MEEYFEEDDYCPICEDDTLHYYYSQGHERDSTYDYDICLVCGLKRTGYGISNQADNGTLASLWEKYEKKVDDTSKPFTEVTPENNMIFVVGAVYNLIQWKMLEAENVQIPGRNISAFDRLETEGYMPPLYDIVVCVHELGLHFATEVILGLYHYYELKEKNEH